jgi:DNA-binding CsgD family transcriptional regulator
MTPETIEQMRQERSAGASPAELAVKYHRSVSTIRRLCRGITPPRGGGSTPGRHRVENVETVEMWRLWVSGVSQAQIGERYGMSQPAVSERLTRYAANLPTSTREALFARELALLDELRQREMAIFTNQSLPAKTRLEAADRVLRGMERLAKMTGLDATADLNVSTTVRYEILGVPNEALG